MKIDFPVKRCHFGLVPYPTWYLGSGVARAMAYTTDRFAALRSVKTGVQVGLGSSSGGLGETCHQCIRIGLGLVKGARVQGSLRPSEARAATMNFHRGAPA